MVRELLRRQETPILAVDADPNANLGEILGTPVKVTVGGAREEAFMGVKEIPTGWDKQSWIEYKMHEALSEAEGYDLLTMVVRKVPAVIVTPTTCSASTSPHWQLNIRGW